MSDQVSLTQKWLRQNIHLYTRKDHVYGHVDSVLTAFPTLRPKTDVYTFDDGRSQLLLCVHGLLPIAYRRASYNIPIAVWLTLGYPTQPPLVYVVPTSDMLVKAGKHVDVSGRCEPPYVQAWKKKSEGCNLTALMETLVDQFSQEPPVYAKPKSTSPSPRAPEQTTSTSGKPDYSNRPPPAAPGSSRSNGYMPSDAAGPGPASSSPPASASNVAHPLIRPPTRSPPPPVPQYSRIPSQNVYHSPRSASASSVQDPPTYIMPSHRPHPRSPPSHLRSSSATHLSPSIQSPEQPYSHPEQASHQRWSMPPGNIQTQSNGPPPPPPRPLHSPPRPSHSAAPPPPLKFIPPTHAMHPVPPTPTYNFLEDEVEVPQPPSPPQNAPPRPPNPEILRLHAQVHAKFTSEFTAFEQAVTTDTQRLRAAQSDLLAGEPAIRDEMARLEAVRDVCSVVASRLRATVESAEANLQEIRKKGDPEVDELICSTTIVHNQLIDLVAEDNAIEDTIYHLHRALNAGRIDLDKFLRTTRALAEEQFMKRALAQKIVASIPLGAWR